MLNQTATEAHYEKAGASLLSEQPSDATPPKSPQQEIMEWKVLENHLTTRLQGLLTWRTSWWTQNWSDLAQYIEPKRSIWLTQSTGGVPSPNSNTRGRAINSSIADPTGTYAARVCASGMMAGLASPARPWFKIVPSVKGIVIDAEGRAWLDEVEDRVYTILAGSNFYQSVATEMEDLTVFGTAPVIIYEDEKDIIRCYNPAVGEYYLGSDATMRVEPLMRLFVKTISQIVDFFGIENCPEDVIKMWNTKGNALEMERLVAHAIEPNFAIKDTGIGKVKGKFAWREVYWVYGAGSNKPLSIRGFVEQPFTCARWSTQSNDAYGRSVGMDVLPDIIQLQVETMRKAEAIEKQVRPPLQASMDLKNQPSSILPGAVTYVNNISANTGMRPIYQVTPQLGDMRQDLAEIQARIQRGFFNDILLPLLSNPGDRRTAYETAQMISEKLSVIGPVIENITNESLKPRLKRVFGIIKRRNLLPPMPDGLKDVQLDIEFVSTLAMAQKSSATGGMERILAAIGNMTAVYPEARDKLNVDNFIDTLNLMLDNPQNILRSNEEVAKIREAQAAAMEEKAGMEEAMGAATVAKTGADAAKVLSQTEVGAGQTALSQLFGG